MANMMEESIIINSTTNFQIGNKNFFLKQGSRVSKNGEITSHYQVLNKQITLKRRSKSFSDFGNNNPTTAINNDDPTVSQNVNKVKRRQRIGSDSDVPHSTLMKKKFKPSVSEDETKLYDYLSKNDYNSPDGGPIKLKNNESFWSVLLFLLSLLYTKEVIANFEKEGRERLIKIVLKIGDSLQLNHPLKRSSLLNPLAPYENKYTLSFLANLCDYIDNDDYDFCQTLHQFQFSKEHDLDQ